MFVDGASVADEGGGESWPMGSIWCCMIQRTVRPAGVRWQPHLISCFWYRINATDVPLRACGPANAAQAHACVASRDPEQGWPGRVLTMMMHCACQRQHRVCLVACCSIMNSDRQRRMMVNSKRYRANTGFRFELGGGGKRDWAVGNDSCKRRAKFEVERRKQKGPF